MASASSSAASSVTHAPRKTGQFSVLVSGIRDENPHGAPSIPTAWLQRLLIDLELGKIRVRQGFEVESRYSSGCPRQYFLRVRVHFDATINTDFRARIESGQTARMVYAEKGTPYGRHQRPLKQDKFLTIEPDTPALQAARTAEAASRAAAKQKAAEATAAQRSKRAKIAKPANAFTALAVEDDSDDGDSD